MTSRATAIVVTYNSQDQIEASLAALRPAALDVIVVDNASVDGTAAIVRRHFPEVVVITNDENVGFARAVNQGVAHLRTETVLLVNPDCTLPPATAEGLVRFLAERPDVGVAGPRLVDPAGRVAVSAHPFESLASVVLSRFGGGLVPVGLRRLLSGDRRRRSYDACRESSDPTSVDWLSGACLAVRTDLLRATGGLDERYFLYYEDEELCWQARRRGKDVVYVPTLVATHVGGASSEHGTTWPHLYRSMLVFFASHRRSSYQAVRIAVLVRAGIGTATGLLRLALRRPGGASRATAWRRVMGIAWAGAPEQFEGIAA